MKDQFENGFQSECIGEGNNYIKLVENLRLRRAQAEHSFLELVLIDGGIRETITCGNFVTVNSIMKRHNLKRGEISEVTKSCNF